MRAASRACGIIEKCFERWRHGCDLLAHYLVWGCCGVYIFASWMKPLLFGRGGASAIDSGMCAAKFKDARVGVY